MRDLITSLFSGSEHYDLYMDVIKAVEGIVRDSPDDAWRRKIICDTELGEAVQSAV